MTDRALIELRDRVRAAEGADRELDGLIAKHFGELPADAWWMTENVYGEPVAEWVSGGYGDYTFHEPEEYTRSVDAALALVSVKLPGMERNILRWAVTRMGVAREDWSQDRFCRAILTEFFIALAETGG